MRIAVTYGPMCLLRPALETRTDPRTGSEIGWLRISEGLEAARHIVTTYDGRNDPAERYRPDAVVAINEPDRLREFPDAKLRICMFWLNEFSFCKEGFDEHVHWYFSPSEAHRQQAITTWGAPRPEKWHVNRLGCDASTGLPGVAGRSHGRVVYCSSPDRGLHRVLEAWPAIKRAVPHATLRIFYRLEPWIRGFDATPYFPPIERNRTRALYVEEALNRLGTGWGIEVHDSISREQLQLELQEAEVFLHPCDTLSWSEGFSCSTMEACAAGAAPIISDCDALGEVYAPLEPTRVGDWAAWRDRVIRALKDQEYRQDLSQRAVRLAGEHTWSAHVSRLDQFIRTHS